MGSSRCCCCEPGCCPGRRAILTVDKSDCMIWCCASIVTQKLIFDCGVHGIQEFVLPPLCRRSSSCFTGRSWDVRRCLTETVGQTCEATRPPAPCPTHGSSPQNTVR